ncbi:cation diffusion facilitator family transporter [Actinopolymorpha sp. B9G3]|uniref:cation diffusion facilitator family transporter n=1 Tax=Actinopolymorpha sp. B9G3 TaxID=3158970 RepID=UPI0032D99D16
MRFSVLALSGYALAAVLVVGVRGLIQLLRTGDTGVRPPRRSGSVGGRVRWWVSLRTLAPLLVLAAAPVAELAGLPALPILDTPAVRLTGLALAGVGIAAVFTAQLAMGRSWRIGVAETERTDLVTTGPFRLVRNPIFTAGLVATAGLVLAVPNVLAVAGWAWLLITVQRQVRGSEEPYLRGVHGADYDAYAARVGRFVPGVGRFRAPVHDGKAPRAPATDRGHDHSHGVHGVTATGRHRRLLAATLAISLAIFAIQVTGAFLTGSLALLGDAGHVLGDAGGVALALGATLLASRPAAGHHTFGWARAEILAAAANGLMLTLIGGYVLLESVRRLLEPTAVEPGGMAVFGAIGLAGNLVGVALLYRARAASLNLRGAFLEVATDSATSVGVLVAAGVIAVTGFTRADALVSMAIGFVIVPRALRLLREAVDVLLEAAPAELDLDHIRTHICRVDHVRDVHDLHVHTVTSGLPVLSAHVVVEAGCFHDGHAPQLLDALQACLAGHFDVEHSTFQLEPVGHADHEHDTHA